MLALNWKTWSQRGGEEGEEEDEEEEIKTSVVRKKKQQFAWDHRCQLAQKKNPTAMTGLLEGRRFAQEIILSTAAATVVTPRQFLFVVCISSV